MSEIIWSYIIAKNHQILHWDCIIIHQNLETNFFLVTCQKTSQIYVVYGRLTFVSELIPITEIRNFLKMK